MRQLRIRFAETPDVPKLLAIARASPQASQWPIEEYARIVAQFDATEECRVAVADDSVAGFVVTRTVSDEVEIVNLAVAPQRRRQGIAAALLTDALDAAQRAGARRVFLEVRESNSAALAFYTRHGFANAGRRRAYYSNPVEDAIILSRNL